MVYFIEVLMSPPMVVPFRLFSQLCFSLLFQFLLLPASTLPALGMFFKNRKPNSSQAQKSKTFLVVTLDGMVCTFLLFMYFD